MTPRKPKTTTENGNGDTKLTTAVRLGQVETQLNFLTTAIDKLGEQIEKAETVRSANLLDYVQAHSKVVADCLDNTEDIQVLRKEFDASLTDNSQSFEEVDKRLDKWEKDILPLLTAHKVLVWVAVFFASSIGLLLWGIFTHTVSLIYTK